MSEKKTDNSTSAPRAINTWRRTTPVQDDQPASKRSARPASKEHAFDHYFRSVRLMHKTAFVQALKRLISTPASSLMTILVLGVALALPGTLSLTLTNLQAALNNVGSSVHVSLYLEAGTSNRAALQMREALQKDPAVVQVKYISPERGLEEFSKYSGLGDTLKLLDNNPLPGVIDIEPADTSPLAVSNLRNRLTRLSGVEDIRIDDQWLKRLDALLTLGERVLFGLSALMILAVLLIIGNTIRLLVANRKDEIQVVRLVGGSDTYILLPFVYTGLWYGVAGGLAAWLIILLIWMFVDAPVAVLASLYQSPFQLGFPGLDLFLLLLGGCATLGVVGAFLSSWHHLRSLDP